MPVAVAAAVAGGGRCVRGWAVRACVLAVSVGRGAEGEVCTQESGESSGHCTRKSVEPSSFCRESSSCSGSSSSYRVPAAAGAPSPPSD